MDHFKYSKLCGPRISLLLVKSAWWWLHIQVSKNGGGVSNGSQARPGYNFENALA